MRSAPAAGWQVAMSRPGTMVTAGTSDRPPPSPARAGVASRASVPGWIRAAVVLAAVVAALLAARGAAATGQATIDGLITGTYFALGAIGLSLVFGVLRLVNFAHGDMLTFGAYVALLLNVTLGLPIVLAAVGGIIAAALLAALLELILWRPMRTRGAGSLQLLLIAIGLAFVIRNCIQLVAGADSQDLGVNVTTAIGLPGGLRIGTVELVVVIVGLIVLVTVATFLRFSRVGKEMRALSDNVSLAEVAGIDTGRVILITWLVGGGLAGLAGVLSGSVAGVLTPNFGFELLLSLFAAMVLGGIGNAYGALAGGLLLGLVEEWSTMFIDPSWKTAVGFAVLILTLLLRPSGLLGRPALK